MADPTDNITTRLERSGLARAEAIAAAVALEEKRLAHEAEAEEKRLDREAGRKVCGSYGGGGEVASPKISAAASGTLLPVSAKAGRASRGMRGALAT